MHYKLYRLGVLEVQPGETMHTRNWLADFEFAPGEVRVKKTGARIPVSRDITRATLSWLRFFVTLAARRPRTEGFQVAFAPDRPRPWYLIWVVLHAAGARIVDQFAEADIVFHFDDSIHSPTPPPSQLKPGARLINFAARDVTKTTVTRVFTETFGYDLGIDPTTYDGAMVEKSERNGVHDGRIVQGPLKAPRAGHVYQRVIDNRAPDGMVEDLRTVVVGDRLGCVFVKRRTLDKRFSNDNAEVLLRDPSDLFTPEERAAILRFARGLGLDWGGLDVLRDARDQRIYIVDANKTDMGPPTTLSLADKLVATERLATAFKEAFGVVDRG